jgi:hypothetical protein
MQKIREMLEIEMMVRHAPGSISGRHPSGGKRSSIFCRRVGSPGYGRGSFQGQKEAALAVCRSRFVRIFLFDGFVRFFGGFWEKRSVGCGFLMVNVWWNRGELWCVDDHFLELKNFPWILDLFFGVSFWGLTWIKMGALLRSYGLVFWCGSGGQFPAASCVLEIDSGCQLHAAGFAYSGGSPEGGVRIGGIGS